MPVDGAISHESVGITEQWWAGATGVEVVVVLAGLVRRVEGSVPPRVGLGDVLPDLVEITVAVEDEVEQLRAEALGTAIVTNEGAMPTALGSHYPNHCSGCHCGKLSRRPVLRAPAVQSGEPFTPPGRPPRVPLPQAKAQRRDAPRDDADAIVGEDFELDSAAPLPASAPVRRVRPPLAVARCRGAPWTRGESRRERAPRRSGRRRRLPPHRSSRAPRGRRPSAAATARTPWVAARGRALGTAS